MLGGSQWPPSPEAIRSAQRSAPCRQLDNAHVATRKIELPTSHALLTAGDPVASTKLFARADELLVPFFRPRFDSGRIPRRTIQMEADLVLLDESVLDLIGGGWDFELPGNPGNYKLVGNAGETPSNNPNFIIGGSFIPLNNGRAGNSSN